MKIAKISILSFHSIPLKNYSAIRKRPKNTHHGGLTSLYPRQGKRTTTGESTDATHMGREKTAEKKGVVFSMGGGGACFSFALQVALI